MSAGVFASDCLAGRTALITGGGSGVGFGIAQGLSAAGARVVLVSRNLDRLQEATKALRSAKAEAIAVPADVRDGETVQAAVATTVDRFGGLDIMIANAAGNFVVPFADMSFNAWRTVIDIDLHGTFTARKPPTRTSRRRHMADDLSLSQRCAH